MAPLTRSSLTRWENGKAVTYRKGDDVPDLKSEGSPDKPNVFLTLEEGAKVPARKGAKTPSPVRESDTDNDTESDNLDIIQLLEGNVASVVSWVKSQTRVSTLEDALVAEGEGKNRSTITAAINDQIKALEEGQE